MELLGKVLEEIRLNRKVAGYRLLTNNELEIHFVDSYKNLIIPIDSKMNHDNVLTVFYYYLENYKGQ